jgi:RND family efflux transporter MFP subunit
MAVAILLLALLLACSSGPAAKSDPPKPAPAPVRNRVSEGELATVTLTPEAEQRLGIATAAVENQKAERRRTWGGEIVAVPGAEITVTAPAAGRLLVQSALPAAGTRVRQGQALFQLRPLLAAERDLRVALEAEAAAAAARLEAARSRAARAEQLLQDQVGTVRAQEQAREELKLAETALAAAREKLDRLARSPLEADVSLAMASPRDGLLRRVYAAGGQNVPAGAPLFEVVSLETVWVRVPVYAGQAGELSPGVTARVAPLGSAGGPAVLARPVPAPPSADPLSATVDLVFELSNPDLAWHPGQKVNATLPLRTSREALQAPRSAVIRDIQGGAWVYEHTAPQVYVRRRVEVEEISGATVILSRGPKPGTKVVVAGAAELYGTEFGPGK